MSHVIYNISITTWCISVYTEHSIIVIQITGHNCNKNCNKNQVVIEVLWSLTNVVMDNVNMSIVNAVLMSLKNVVIRIVIVLVVLGEK